MNEWHVYSYLKRVNGQATRKELIDKFYTGSDEDLRLIDKGIFEYNEMAKESFGYFKPMKTEEIA